MAMPSAKGLFHKAIVQSGAEELMGMSLPNQDATRRVAELTLQRLNLTPDELDKLQTIPYEWLAMEANKAYLQAVEEFGTDKLYPGLGAVCKLLFD